MTTIYFVRHSRPDLSVHDDSSRPLSPKGQEDCQKIQTFFQQIPIDQFLTSPFKRSYDTILPLAQSRAMTITTMENLRERKVSDDWLADFSTFAYNQWHDFSFKLEKGESLQEVQARTTQTINHLLTEYQGKTLVIGTHGTALSTLINHYDQDFGFEAFTAIKGIMPWIVKMTFGKKKCLTIDSYDLMEQPQFTYHRDFNGPLKQRSHK